MVHLEVIKLSDKPNGFDGYCDGKSDTFGGYYLQYGVGEYYPWFELSTYSTFIGKLPMPRLPVDFCSWVMFIYTWTFVVTYGFLSWVKSFFLVMDLSSLLVLVYALFELALHQTLSTPYLHFNWCCWGVFINWDLVDGSSDHLLHVTNRPSS